MASSLPSSTFDPTASLGLVDTRVLRELRRQEAEKAAILRRQTTTGVDYASAELGNALGIGIRKLLGRAGIMKDPELERAEKIDSARARATNYVASIPEEMRSTDPLESSIQERQALMDELTAAGLHAEADTIRGQVLDLRKQQFEFKKLQVDTDAAQSLADSRALDASYKADTYNDRVAAERAKRVNEQAQAQITLGTAGNQIALSGTQLAQAQEKLRHDRTMAPFLEARARDEATVAALQARAGGPLMKLDKLQLRRDQLLTYIADNPGSAYAKQQLEEVSQAIQTEITNTQNVKSTNLDNTTQTRSQLQDDIGALAGIQTSLSSLVTDLGTLDGKQPYGATGNLRSQVAGYGTQVLSLVGAPIAVQDAFNNTLYSDKEQDLLSRTRQLKEQLTDWLKGSRAGQVDRERADDLLQALDRPDVTVRDVMISLANLSKFLAERQATAFSILNDNVGVVMQGAGAARIGAPANTDPLNDAWNGLDNQ